MYIIICCLSLKLEKIIILLLISGESWAIFDQGVPPESIKEKQTVQSEEGISPWSSDSKEFGNGSPLEWQRGDSESGCDHWSRRRIRKDQEGWWDTSAEPEGDIYNFCTISLNTLLLF